MPNDEDIYIPQPYQNMAGIPHGSDPRQRRATPPPSPVQVGIEKGTGAAHSHILHLKKGRTLCFKDKLEQHKDELIEVIGLRIGLVQKRFNRGHTFVVWYAVI